MRTKVGSAPMAQPCANFAQYQKHRPRRDAACLLFILVAVLVACGGPTQDRAIQSQDSRSGPTSIPQQPESPTAIPSSRGNPAGAAELKSVRLDDVNVQSFFGGQDFDQLRTDVNDPAVAYGLPSLSEFLKTARALLLYNAYGAKGGCVDSKPCSLQSILIFFPTADNITAWKNLQAQLPDTRQDVTTNELDNEKDWPSAQCTSGLAPSGQPQTPPRILTACHFYAGRFYFGLTATVYGQPPDNWLRGVGLLSGVILSKEKAAFKE